VEEKLNPSEQQKPLVTHSSSHRERGHRSLKDKRPSSRREKPSGRRDDSACEAAAAAAAGSASVPSSSSAAAPPPPAVPAPPPAPPPPPPPPPAPPPPPPAPKVDAPRNALLDAIRNPNNLNKVSAPHHTPCVMCDDDTGAAAAAAFLSQRFSRPNTPSTRPQSRVTRTPTPLAAQKGGGRRREQHASLRCRADVRPPHAAPAAAPRDGLQLADGEQDGLPKKYSVQRRRRRRLGG
jgi:hypothetical protein